MYAQRGERAFQCWKVLHALNSIIENMYMLSDGYYRDYIWNADSETKTQLKINGLDDDNYYLDIAYKLEALRAILFGHNADWRKIENEIYDHLLTYEVSQHRYYEDSFTSAIYERDKLRKEIDNLREEKK